MECFAALWIAEFIETLPTEIDSIWVNRKITGTSMLFLMNRYMFLLGLIFQALRVLPGNGTNKECQVIDGLYSLLQCVTSAITNILFTLRIYAIYNKNRFVLISSLTMIFFIFIFEVLIEALEPGISTVGSPFQIFSRCKTNPKVEIGIPFVVFGYDLFIFILTVRETVHHAINMHRICPGQSSIAQIIVRDASPGNTADPLSDVVGPFFNVFSNLLISRLMLNLQTFTTSTITTSQGAASTGQSSSLHFAQRMLGNRNIGGTLDGDFIGEEIEFE
ncbi:hypothetical protein C8J55DRAFT_527398 [Lentinula edodes]|uniref:DUF6533 domain-containing protein n=1 Tax=Lentinula lateritia TaxID=40482 RepID=A0A9W9DEW0_9AGAR|nr:hypothetical protein C8J55DRAFT_527398 [Lentinula edodes]